MLTFNSKSWSIFLSTTLLILSVLVSYLIHSPNLAVAVDNPSCTQYIATLSDVIKEADNEYNAQGSWKVIWGFSDPDTPEAQTRYSEVKIGFKALRGNATTNMDSVLSHPFGITADWHGSSTAYTNHYASLTQGTYRAEVYNFPGNDSGWRNERDIDRAGIALAKSSTFTLPNLPDDRDDVSSRIP